MPQTSAAGCRPAAMALAQCGFWEPKRRPTHHRLASWARIDRGCSPSSTAPFVALNRMNAAQPPRPQLPNPHKGALHAQCLISRGFLPWRVSDAGPRWMPPRRHGADIRNPSQHPPLIAGVNRGGWSSTSGRSMQCAQDVPCRHSQLRSVRRLATRRAGEQNRSRLDRSPTHCCPSCWRLCRDTHPVAAASGFSALLRPPR